MRFILPRLWSAAVLGATMMAPIALAPTSLRAQDHQDHNAQARTYHDKQHNDDHEWNAHEDQAYKIYKKQNHRSSKEFSKLKANDQQAYWAWRHEHSDAVLKIEVR